MKVCPQCDQTFNDDSMQFCLMDGSALVPAESQPTVVMAQPGVTQTEPTVVRTVPMTAVEPVKKKNTGLWVGLIIVVMLFGIVAVAGILLFFFSGQKETALGNQKNGVNTNAPSKPAATPKATPSPAASATPAADAPPANGVKPPAGDGADDITPIAWTTSAATFRTDVGQTYKFQCPDNGIPEMIWGSDIYTADSSICTAAVHAGVITLEKGGVVTLEFRPGRMTYGSTVRNGITSNTFGEFAHSFVVR